jgi:hypothetical protein
MSDTKTIDDLVALLRARPGLTCTEIGAALWGRQSRQPQCYARPAGRLVQRAVQAGRVYRGRCEIYCNRRIFFPSKAPSRPEAVTTEET